MDWLIGQLAVIGRRADGDESGWMQLLVFVVLAVFWAIGGIMKARAASKSQAGKDKKERGPQPQARPRPSFERLLRAQPEKARTRPMGTKAARMARQLERDKAAEQTVEQPVTAQARDYGYQEISPPEIEQAKPVAETAPAEAKTVLAVAEGRPVEIGTTEQLRAAIVHYEIFGKCVALRGVEQSVWSR